MLFDNIIGQEQAKKILSALYHKQHYPPLLFVGPAGVGKRTMAINFAQLINCPDQTDVESNKCPRCQQIGNLLHPDIKIIFPITAGFSSESDESKVLQELGNNTSLFALGKSKPFIPAINLIPIKIIRWLKQEMAYKPIICRHKIIIILNADRMNQEAANAFLKTLEEPQAQTLFILTTEKASNILLTIRSRCQTIRFSAIPKNLIIQYLILEKGIAEADAQFAAEIAEGSLRKAMDFHYQTESFLPSSDLLNLFDRTQTSSLESLNSMLNYDFDSNPPEKLIKGLLFIYRKALQIKLSVNCNYDVDIVKKIANSLTSEQIISRISFLINALHDVQIHLNKKLYLYSVLSTVRF
jgi:DNA polymerase III gamma/tau subunit